MYDNAVLYSQSTSFVLIKTISLDMGSGLYCKTTFSLFQDHPNDKEMTFLEDIKI